MTGHQRAGPARAKRWMLPQATGLLAVGSDTGHLARCTLKQQGHGWSTARMSQQWWCDEEASVSDVLRCLTSYYLGRTQDIPVNFTAQMLPSHEPFPGSARTRPYESALLSVQSVWYTLNDNGGELMLECLNSGRTAQPIPLTSHGFPLNPGTVAGRVATLLRGEAIDYEWRLTNSEQQVVCG